MRAAASRAIECAGCEPVLAENFPAGTVSPRTACLDGVASCDGIVLILGARYGEPTVAGISATEEYREAVRLKKHIFVFLEAGDREPRQQEFVRSVEDYVVGHWRKTFRTPEELEELVEQALREGRPMVATGNAEGGSRERIGAAFAEKPDRVECIVWAQVAWTTPRDEEVVDPTDFIELHCSMDESGRVILDLGPKTANSIYTDRRDGCYSSAYFHPGLCRASLG